MPTASTLPARTGARARPRRLLVAATVLAVLAQLWALYLYQPGPPGPEILPHADKLVHATIFALPVVLAGAAGLRWRLLLLVLVVHAPVSEVVQLTWLTGRSGDPWDVLADLAGLAVAAALVAWCFSPDEPAPSAPALGDDADRPLDRGDAGGDH